MTVKASWALFLALIVAGCGGAPTQVQKESHFAKPDPDGVQRIRVSGGNYFFKPNHLVVKANVPVELLASREAGMTPHDLVILAPDASVLMKEQLSTEPRKISFTPRKPGTYLFYCSKNLPFAGSHRERGMEGVLEVVP